MNTQQVVQKLWNYRNILRDDGISYGDYVKQPTYLLFLKMACERAQLLARPHTRPLQIPEDCSWKSLMERDGMQKRPLPACGGETVEYWFFQRLLPPGCK